MAESVSCCRDEVAGFPVGDAEPAFVDTIQAQPHSGRREKPSRNRESADDAGLSSLLSAARAGDFRAGHTVGEGPRVRDEDIVEEIRRLIERCAGTRQGETKAVWLSRGCRRLGLTDSRGKKYYYREVTSPPAAEVRNIRCRATRYLAEESAAGARGGSLIRRLLDDIVKLERRLADALDAEVVAPGGARAIAPPGLGRRGNAAGPLGQSNRFGFEGGT